MSLNQVYDDADSLEVPVPEGTKSGDPVMIGQRPGVAQTNRNANGEATVRFKGGFRLAVVGKNKAGEKAVAFGDILYMKGTEINVNNEEGIRFGYAWGTVVKNKTEVILVILGT